MTAAFEPGQPTSAQQQAAALELEWAANPRWEGVTRDYSATDVVRPLRHQAHGGPGFQVNAVSRGPDYNVHALAFSPDNQTFASAGNDQAVRWWVIDKMQNPRQAQGTNGAAVAVA